MSEEFFCFMSGLVIGVLVAMSFAVNNKDYITKTEYEYAQTLCVDNKGLKEVGNAGARYKAICMNNAEFNYTAGDMRSKGNE